MSIMARMKPAWPVIVRGEGPITVTQANGVATIGADFSDAEFVAQIDQAVDAAANSATAALGSQTAAETAQDGAEAAQAAAELAAGAFVAADQPQAEAGTDAVAYMSPLRVTQRIRVLNGEISVNDFVTAPSDGTTGYDTAAGINAALAYAQANDYNLVIPGDIWPLDGPINTPGKVIRIRGEQGRAQKTIFYKRYAEAVATRGIVSFGAWGGALQDVQFAASAGASGGVSISAILPNPIPNVDVLILDNIRSSCGNGIDYNLFISGAANVTPSGPGYRSIFADSLDFFSGKMGSVLIVDAHHVFISKSFIAQANDTLTGFVLDIQGSDVATRYNDDIQFCGGFIAGNVQLGYLNRSAIMSPIYGTVTYQDHCNSVQLLTASGGVLGASPPDSFVLSHNAIVARGGSPLNGWIRYGDGRLHQWGTVATSGGGVATVTFTVPFAATPQHIKVTARETLTPPITYIPQATVVADSTTAFTVCTHSVLVPGGTNATLNCAVYWEASGV